MKKTMKLKDEDFARMEKVNHPYNRHIDDNKYFYLSYGLRIFLMFTSIVILGVVAYSCFNDSFSEARDAKLRYEEKGQIDSNVQLFENNPFGDGILDTTGIYHSDMIDKIGTDFKYSYTFDKEVNVDYSYYVVATMELKNVDGKVLSTNDYELIPKDEKIEKSESNVKSINLNQNINLDYVYYNNLAKEVRSQYGIDLYGNLYIKMYIDTNVKYAQFEENKGKEQVLEVSIPLMSSQVSVDLVNGIDNKDTYVEHTNPKLIKPTILYLGVSLLIVDTLFFLLSLGFIFKSTPKKSKYSSLRDGLLRDYDRVIVNCKKLPSVEGYKIIDCYSFSELMDAQRLLEKPILYFEIVKNQKCVFMILGNNEVYKFVLKECDLEF